MGGLVNTLGFGGGYQAQPANVVKDPDLLRAIKSARGDVDINMNNQNAFAKALMDQINGNGPNLAGQLLSNATGQNVANQAALMAGQRGSNSNVGLIARQAAQQGAGIQQQAVGQAATNRLQQQMDTQNQLQSLYGTIGQESGNNLAANNNALAGQNSNEVSSVNAANATNEKNFENQSKNALSTISGVGQGAIKAGLPSVAAAVFAEGGEVSDTSNQSANLKEYTSELPEHLKHVSEDYHPHMSHKKVSALVSPGEKILTPKEVKKVESGKEEPIKAGKTVPGKPKVPGAVNSYENDTEPKKLTEGSIVLPRSVTQAKDPAKEAMKFVNAVLAKQKRKA